MKTFGLIAVLVLAGGCLEDKKEPGDMNHALDSTGGGALAWFKTCGDPVCGNPNRPDAAAADLCVDQAEGATCTTADASCATGDDCGTRLLCTTEDPRQQPGGCPISLARHKRGVSYLSGDQRDAVVRDLLAVRLATYEYKGAPGESRLGFLIDDVGRGYGRKRHKEGPEALRASPSYAVLPNGQQVDVYGFASMAVAAIQEQHARIAELEMRLGRLEAKCD